MEPIAPRRVGRSRTFVLLLHNTSPMTTAEKPLRYDRASRGDGFSLPEHVRSSLEVQILRACDDVLGSTTAAVSDPPGCAGPFYTHALSKGTAEPC